MKKKLLETTIICLMLSLLLGATAFAEEPVSVNVSASEPAEAQVLSTNLTETSDTGGVVAVETGAESSVEFSAVQEEPAAIGEDTSETSEISEISEISETSEINVLLGEEPEEISFEALVQPDATEEITEGDNNIPAEQSAEEENVVAPTTEQAAEEPAKAALPYVVTVSNGDKSVDLTGGTVNSISYILSELGYDVADAEITFDPESVDTEVISVDENEDGLALSDKGPFSQADRKLVVYINGESVELTVVDPYEIGNPDTLTEYDYRDLVENFLNIDDWHVRLIGNVDIIVRDGCNGLIELKDGHVHDLYLNGYTLNLGSSRFSVEKHPDFEYGFTALNIYGGYDRSSPDIGKNGKIGSIITAENQAGSTSTDNDVSSNQDSCAAVSVKNNGSVTLNSGIITGNDSDYGGGVYVGKNGSFTMNGGTITNNRASCHGGGVYVENSGSFTMNGGTITDNTANYLGGGVYVNTNGHFNMNGGTVTNNRAGYYGGGVFSMGSVVLGGGSIINSNNLKGNEAQSNLVIIKENVITVNEGFSGQISATVLDKQNYLPIKGTVTCANSSYVEKYFSCDISGMDVINSSGKAVAFGTATARVETAGGDHYFDTIQNAIDSEGAGSKETPADVSVFMLCDAVESLIIRQFQSVLLDMNGGKKLSTVNPSERAITVYGTLHLKDLYGTEGTIDGGGLCNYGSVIMENCIIANCQAKNGAGIYNAGTLKMYNSKIRNNKASGHGGGIYNVGTIEEFGADIGSNQCAGHGAGIYNAGTMSMSFSRISQNNAYLITRSSTGGGLYNAGTMSMENCRIIGNFGFWGGGICNSENATIYMKDCNIMENVSHDCGSGVQNYGFCTMIGGCVVNNRERDPYSITFNAGFYDCYGNLTIGGKIVMKDNDVVSLMLDHNKGVGVSEEAPLEDGACIFVYPDKYPFNLHTNITKDYSDTWYCLPYFISDIHDNDYMLTRCLDTFNLVLILHYVPESESISSGSADGTPSEVITKAVTMDSLHEAHISAIKETLVAQRLNLVSIVNASVAANNCSVSHIIRIMSDDFKGFEAEDLTVLFVNDDGTLTPVIFEIVNGNIVINNGKMGVYVLTVKA